MFLEILTFQKEIFVQFSYSEYMYERDNTSQLLYAGN